jgi:hypothetical protein
MPLPPLHPACAAWPVPQAMVDKVTADIAVRGQQEPIVMLKGELLDGRIRWLACEAAGVEPVTIEFTKGNPVAYVMSMNVRKEELKRKLKKYELALIGEELANLRNGSNQFAACGREGSEYSLPSFVTQEQAAQSLGVSVGLIKEARKLRANGLPRIIEMVMQGKVGLLDAARVVGHATHEQQATMTPAMVKSLYLGQREHGVLAQQPAATGRRGPPAAPPPPAARSARPAPAPPRSYQDVTGRSGYPPTLHPDEVNLPADPVAQTRHREYYGRAQIVPTLVRDMRDCKGTLESLTDVLEMVLPCPDAEAFFAAADRMLDGIAQHHRPHFRGSGWQDDYPGIARKQERKLRRLLPQVIAKLQAYQDALAARDADQGVTEPGLPEGATAH